MHAASWESVENRIRTEFPEVCSMTTCELADWLADEVRQDPVILDVRSVAEYSVSHLRNAAHATTVDQMIAIVEQSHDRNGIVLYCSVGYRSAKLASQLLAAGVERVFNLRGSIFQWANERRPIFRGKELVTVVHPYNKKWGQLLAAGGDL